MAIVGYRRVTSASPCDFCAALASRGAVFSSDRAADFEAHDGCSCTAEPVWDRNEPEPPEVQGLQDQWERVTDGLSGKEAIAAWRRYWREKRRAPAAAPEPTPAPAPARPPAPPRPPLAQVSDAELRAMSDDELLDRFADVSGRPDLDESALRAVDEELLRRERPDASPAQLAEALDEVELDSPLQRRMDELLAQGRSLESAYAEVYDLDDDLVRRQMLADTIDQQRAAGETRAAAVRRLYDEATHVQFLEAEDWTRGNLLNRAGVAAGIDPISLFSGTRARARRYASEELKRFWEEVSARRTLTEFRAQVLGRASDVRAAGRLAGGNERDFGL